jgi:benzil reductase ((S)-benzoin forming)
MRVFITGISRGLGAGLAEAALRDGAEVWALSRRPPAAGLASLGEGPRFLSVDLARAREAARVEAWLREVPHFDRVYLNAGMLSPTADLAETSLETLREVMEVNVWANKWLLDVLFAGGRRIGQVVAISSGASVSGHRGWNAYGISKAALNMLVRLSAAERPGTHFTALAPGLVDTAMQDALCARAADSRFPTVERLKEARGTASMPDAGTVGRRCWEIAPRLLEEPSGEYLDLRKIAPGR